MPPTVAQNRSGSRSGPTVRTSPSAVTRSSDDDVLAEAAGDVVVLAVDVAGDRAADGDVAGARGDRHEAARAAAARRISSCRRDAGRRRRRGRRPRRAEHAVGRGHAARRRRRSGRRRRSERPSPRASTPRPARPRAAVRRSLAGGGGEHGAARRRGPAPAGAAARGRCVSHRAPRGDQHQPDHADRLAGRGRARTMSSGSPAAPASMSTAYRSSAEHERRDRQRRATARRAGSARSNAHRL